MGRTLSLLVALVCLSAPEFAHHMMGDALLIENGGGTLAPRSRLSAERSRVSFRSLPDCLRVARQSSVHALYQWAWAEAAVAAGSPIVDLGYRPSCPRVVSSSAVRTFSLFERPPPVA